MITLVICWSLISGQCVFSEQYRYPSIYSCMKSKRERIQKWINEGVKEPVFIKCKRQVIK